MFDKKEYDKKYYIEHKEEKKERSRQWRKANPDKLKEKIKMWHKEHPKECNEYMKRWKNNHIKNVKEIDKRWAKNNPKKIKEKAKEYYAKNKEKLLKYHNEWFKNKIRTDIRYNLNHKIKHSIYLALRGNKKGRHWETLVGYTLKDLIKRLNKTMPKGYCWQDFLQGKLHIDHKIPISAFNFNKPEHTDFQRCWALANLQLLPAKENITKHNKLSKPFQPALKI